jgi:hypothetical protein
VLLVALCAACGRGTTLPAPSPVQPPPSALVVAVLGGNGVLLKAEHLEAAHQVEGVILWYQSFDRGRWWFSSRDWEWLIIPTAGRMSWGLWRDEGASGDGVLGVIRFEGEPTIERLTVWVDGRPVQAIMQDRRADESGAGADGLEPASGSRGMQGRPPLSHWSLQALVGQ